MSPPRRGGTASPGVRWRDRVKPGPHRTRQRCSGSVCDRTSASRPVPSRQNRIQRRGGGFDGTERAGTRPDGRKQGRNSADGCGKDRASDGGGRGLDRPARRHFSSPCAGSGLEYWGGKVWGRGWNRCEEACDVALVEYSLDYAGRLGRPLSEPGEGECI